MSARSCERSVIDPSSFATSSRAREVRRTTAPRTKDSVQATERVLARSEGPCACYAPPLANRCSSSARALSQRQEFRHRSHVSCRASSFERAVDCGPKRTLPDTVRAPDVSNTTPECERLRRPPFLEEWLQPSLVRPCPQHHHKEMRWIRSDVQERVVAHGRRDFFTGKHDHRRG